MLALGCDPDLHHAGLALVYYDPIERLLPVVKWTGVALAPTKLKSYAAASALVWPALPLGWRPNLLVVEGQKIYPHSQVRPADLMHLAFAAGCALMAYRFEAAGNVVVPLPQEWKGSVPKEVAHQRILARCIVPPSFLAGPHTSHIIDAIGLALWGLGLPGAIQQGRLRA
jgi:hypothetical protein